MKTLTKTTKSPLRYPGGKCRYVKHILPLIPENVKVASPFMGGGSVELALMGREQPLIVNDGFAPVANFWQVLQKKALRSEMISKVKFLRSLSMEEIKIEYPLHRIQAQRVNESVAAAASFFLVNRCSFGGTTLSGGFSRSACTERFTLSSIQRLADVKTDFLKRVYNLDFREFFSLPFTQDCFFYLDPPYHNIGGLYGRNGDMTFGHADHEDLRDKLLLTRRPWALSYNDCKWVRDNYKQFRIIELPASYSMTNGKNPVPELLITNQ
jgi:DNA adenine methylase